MFCWHRIVLFYDSLRDSRCSDNQGQLPACRGDLQQRGVERCMKIVIRGGEGSIMHGEKTFIFEDSTICLLIAFRWINILDH